MHKIFYIGIGEETVPWDNFLRQTIKLVKWRNKSLDSQPTVQKFLLTLYFPFRRANICIIPISRTDKIFTRIPRLPLLASDFKRHRITERERGKKNLTIVVSPTFPHNEILSTINHVALIIQHQNWKRRKPMSVLSVIIFHVEFCRLVSKGRGGSC